jgi:hypothetical protein
VLSHDPPPASDDTAVVRESAAARDGLFGVIEAFLLVALVRGVLGASTTAGAIAAALFMGLFAVVWGLLWRASRGNLLWFEVRNERIDLCHRKWAAAKSIVRQEGEELSILNRGPVRYRYTVLRSRASGIELRTGFTSPKPLQAACEAHGWSFNKPLPPRWKRRHPTPADLHE